MTPSAFDGHFLLGYNYRLSVTDASLAAISHVATANQAVCQLSPIDTYVSADTIMQINISKTKEIILGRISQDNLQLLSTPAGTVERVTTVKLLGIHLDDTLTWSKHVNAITSKATKRLYFLNQLTLGG